MYKEFYLMRKEPFDSHPSPDLFYKSDVHQTAWHYLLQGVKQHEPILLVAGDYGAGKTLLFLKLVRLLQDKGKMPVISVPTPTYNFVMVLEKIIERLLNIPSSGIDTSDESRLQQVIYEYFESRKEGKKEFIYVVIDDVQEFSYAFINKLRIFASYNVSGYFPIRIVLFGHHSFLEMLNYKKMVAFGQRIKRIYFLKPLNFEETREYIYFRLIHSGATGTPMFDDDAIRLIQQSSSGNPRLINNICDNCLLVSSSERSNLVDARLVRTALTKGNLMGIQETGEEEAFEAPQPQAFQPGPVPVGNSMPFHHMSMERPGNGMVLPPDQGLPQYYGNGGPAYEPAPQSNGFQPPPVVAPPQPEPQGRTDGARKKIEYGKLGLIVGLLVVVLVLFFYVLGRAGISGTAAYGEKQLPSKIVRPVPDENRLYDKDAGKMAGEVLRGKSESGLVVCQIPGAAVGYGPILIRED